MTERHQSSCSVYNAPAYEPGPCDCKFRLRNIESGMKEVCGINDAANSTASNRSRPMVGLINRLTPEQREAMLSYDGPEYLGGLGPEVDEAPDKAVEAIRMSDQ